MNVILIGKIIKILRPWRHQDGYLALHASHLTIFVPIQLLFNTEYSTSCILVALVSLLRVIQT